MNIRQIFNQCLNKVLLFGEVDVLFCKFMQYKKCVLQGVRVNQNLKTTQLAFLVRSSKFIRWYCDVCSSLGFKFDCDVFLWCVAFWTADNTVRSLVLLHSQVYYTPRNHHLAMFPSCMDDASLDAHSLLWFGCCIWTVFY